MSTPTVSICVPTWNGAAYLAAALESALAQTLVDFELLLVDDASTDSTLDIVAGIRDPRLQVHRNDRRLGIPGNWNRCLDLARGRYVKFLFQDDLLAPHALERLVAALEAAPGTSLAFSRREVRREGLVRDLAVPGAEDPDVLSFLATFDGSFRGIDLVRRAVQEGRDLAVNVVGEPSFAVLRREAARRAGGFDSRFVQLVDWDLWLRLARESPVVFVDETLGVFRLHGRSQTAANHRRLRTIVECIRILGRVRKIYGQELTPRERRRLIEGQCRYVAHLAGETTRSLAGGSRAAYD